MLLALASVCYAWGSRYRPATQLGQPLSSCNAGIFAPAEREAALLSHSRESLPGKTMVVNWSLDSSRREINVKYEHECIAELTDTEMHDFLVERKRPVGDGSRAAMELSMREWRGVGAPGEPWDDKGVVLPEALAWAKAVEEKEERERVAEKKRVDAEYAALAAAARFDPPERVCAATGVVTGDLRRCARCQRTYYSSREAQKAHWRFHKHTCKAATNAEINEIRAAPLADAVARLKISLFQGGDHLVSLWLRRVRDALDEPHDEDLGELGMHLHTIGRNLIFAGNDDSLSRIFAAPGMAAAMLHGDWLVNADERILKRHGFGAGLPREDSLPDIRDATARRVAEVLRAREDDFDDDMSDRHKGAFTFCYLYFNLAVAGALHGTPSMASTHDGAGARPRTGPCAALLRHRALRLWSCPLVRKCCGDALGPGGSVASHFLQCYLLHAPQPIQDPPGDVVRGLIAAALDESRFSCAPYATTVLKLFVKGDLWDVFDVKARAKALVAILGYALDKCCVDVDKEPEDDSFGMSKTISAEILSGLVGRIFESTPKLGISADAVKLAVLRAGTVEADVGVLGDTDDARGFCYWLIGKAELGARAGAAAAAQGRLPDEMLGAVCEHAADASGLDVFSKSDGLAYYRPRMYGRGDDKDPAIEAARAKARGPRRQAEWAAIFEKD